MNGLTMRHPGVLAAALSVMAVALFAAPPVMAASAEVTDTEDDAYRLPETPAGQPEPRPPMPVWSNDTADILTAAYATAPARPGDDGAYKVSVTTPGAPNGQYNYIVGAQFGADCWVFHYLTVGETRTALTRCGQERVGTIPGSRVTVSGNTISASFSFRWGRVPRDLRETRRFGPLYVLTCPAENRSWACQDHNQLDFAYSQAPFEI